MSTRSELKALRREYGDLLESHGGRRLEEFKRYESDPVGFIREVLKADPWADTLRDDPRFADLLAKLALT